MADYLLARNGQQYGPYPVEVLQQMVREGRANPTDLVWTQGMAQWEVLSRVMPISAHPTPPAPPAGFAPNAYVPPPNTMGMALIPPSLHWALVMLFSTLTCGIFSWIWCIKEASFVKKLDHSSNAVLLMVFNVVANVGANLCYFAAISTSNTDERMGFLMIELGVFLVSFVFLEVAAFQMRRVLLNYYNVTEPIGLRLSGAMTFFFTIFYFQHHFSRIAKWKQTGFLQPQ